MGLYDGLGRGLAGHQVGAFPAIITTAAVIFVDIKVGMIEASITRHRAVWAEVAMESPNFR